MNSFEKQFLSAEEFLPYGGVCVGVEVVVRAWPLHVALLVVVVVVIALNYTSIREGNDHP